MASMKHILHITIRTKRCSGFRFQNSLYFNFRNPLSGRGDAPHRGRVWSYSFSLNMGFGHRRWAR